MKKQKKVLMIVMVSLAAGLFTTSSQAFVWGWIKGAANAITGAVDAAANAVKNTVLTLLNGLELIRQHEGVLKQTAQFTIDNLKAGFDDVVKYQDEPGNYSWFKTIANAINSSAAKAPDHKLLNNEAVGQYIIPKVDKQIDYGKHFVWQKVELDSKTTEAKCANGSNYKFFVNLTPTTDNFVIFYEPGGACFDYESCRALRAKTDQNGIIERDETGRVKAEVPIRGIFNPDGISDHYTDVIGSTFAADDPIDGALKGIKVFVINPITHRLFPFLSPSERVKMQNWNFIYMPYCTGDSHVGDRVGTFRGPDYKLYPEDPKNTLNINFKGLHNTLGMLGWMRENLPRPKQVYLTGSSAGANAVEFHRATIRHVLNPQDSMYSLIDSAFSYGENPGKPMDLDANPAEQSMAKMRRVWLNYLNTDENTKEVKKPLNMLKAIVPDLNIHNISNMSQVITERFPNDRHTYVVSFSDMNYSGYSYMDNPGFDQAAKADGDINVRIPKSFYSNLATYSRESFAKDLKWKRDQIESTNKYLAGKSINKNVGYYMPSGRRFNQSHCLTVLNYDGINIEKETIEGRKVVKSNITLHDVITNLVDRNNPPLITEYEKVDTRKGINAELSKIHKTLAGFPQFAEMMPPLN